MNNKKKKDYCRTLYLSNTLLYNNLSFPTTKKGERLWPFPPALILSCVLASGLI